MGRIVAKSMRARLQDQMKRLRKRYRAALKDDAMQEAFDELWPNWSREMGAMIYAEVLSTMDLLILTAAIDNRRIIMELQQELDMLKRLGLRLNNAQTAVKR